MVSVCVCVRKNSAEVMFKLNLRFNSVTKENRKNFGCSTSTKKREREGRDRAREIERETNEFCVT